GMLSWLRRRAGPGTGGDPACRGSARAAPAEHPLRGPGGPLPVVRPAGPAPPPRADLGCAGSGGAQLGPQAVALAAWLSKGLGVPAAKTARLLGQLGLRVTPGGVTGAVARAARRAQP